MTESVRDAILNQAIPTEKQYEETEIQYGACRFCGQMFQFETIRGMQSEEYLDREATMKCDCQQATRFREREQMEEKIQKAINELFHEDEEEIERLLQKSVPLVIGGEIDVVNITSITGCQAKIKMTQKGKVKVERNEKRRKSREL